MILHAPTPFDENRRTSDARAPVVGLSKPALLLRYAVAALLLGAMLLEPVSKASAMAAVKAGDMAPIDLMDVYLDVVNMNKCCDCHKTIC